MQRDPEKFKIGFLKRAAELGLRPSDFERALKKQSKIGWNPLTWLPGIAEAGKNTMGAIGLGLTGIGAGGVLAGAIARAAARSDDETLEDVKMRDRTKEYRQLTADIRERVARERQKRESEQNQQRPFSPY